MANKYCGNCGAELRPGDRFCERCGHTVPQENDRPATPPPAENPQRPPLGERRDAERRVVRRRWTRAKVIALAIGLLVAAGVVWYHVDPLFRLRVLFFVASLSRTPEATVVQTPEPQTGPSQAAPRLSDFAGNWVVMAGQAPKGAVITLREENGTITATEVETITLTDVVGDKLSGNVTSGGQTYPATAVLTNDRQQLIIAEERSPESFEVTVAWRQGSHPAIRSVTRPPQLGPNSSDTSVSSPEEAMSIVRELPEIRLLLERIPTSDTHLEVTSQTPDAYTVSVSEYMRNPGGGGAAATYGVYNVDKKTGKVYSVSP